jgi:hypothetical protein
MKRILSKFLIIVLVNSIFTLQIVFSQQAKIDALKIQPSEIIGDLQKKKKENPKISAENLAGYANKILAEKGFNFGFDACEIVRANKQYENQTLDWETLKPYFYQLTEINNEKKTFQIMNRNWEVPCDYCIFEMPAFLVTEKEMVLLVEDKKVRFHRPENFGLDEVELVDKSLKKTIKKWQMPGDNVPVGISRDGTKIYVETGYDDYLIEEIVLEISDKGTFQFVSRKDPKIIGNGKQLENFPKDPNDDYLGFISFKSGKMNYIIKLSYPCT